MKTIFQSVAVLLMACNIVLGAEETTQKVRRHPGHKIQVVFSPEKKVFVPGEPVKVVLKVTNIGESDFMFMRGGRQRGARDNQFGFTAQAGNRMLPDIGHPDHFGGLGIFVRVRPKETVEIPVDLKRWFAFDKEGTFQMR